MVKKDSFGDRMKSYENAYRQKLPKRMPVMIRLDGKAFHTYTKNFKKPFDDVLAGAFWDTCKYLCENIMGCKVAYHQSDEITLLLTNDYKLTSEAWFDNNIQKMASVAASLATAKFNGYMRTLEVYSEVGPAFFDARVWVLPQDEVNNAFLWRQQDASKNSISMVAQAHFPHKELQGLNGEQMQDKLYTEKGINWNDLPTWQKRGACVVKRPYTTPLTAVLSITRNRWEIDLDIPKFSENPGYINNLLQRHAEEQNTK